MAAINKINISALEQFAEDEQCFQIIAEVSREAGEFFGEIHKNTHDGFTGSDLSKLRVFQFLNNK